MLNKAIEMIGTDQLEKLALKVHKCSDWNYIIVDPAGEYKRIGRDRANFNSKYHGWDYYSQLVSMNKAISSKLIVSNNYFTFFVKNPAKMTPEVVDQYFLKLDTPEEYKWHAQWIKKNLEEIGSKYGDKIKVFFPGMPEQYRNAGMKNWTEKSISITKYDKEKGAPICHNVNAKKSYDKSAFNTYLVDNETGLQIKLFYDFLKGLYKQGKDILYVWDGGMWATSTKNKEDDGPINRITGAVIFFYRIGNKGALEILDMDTVAGY